MGMGTLRSRVFSCFVCHDLRGEEKHTLTSNGIKPFYETHIGSVFIPHSDLAGRRPVSMSIQLSGSDSLGCANGSFRCTTQEGIPRSLDSSCFYNICEDGKWSEVHPVDAGLSCEGDTLVESDFCDPPPAPLQCSFTGVRCLSDEGILIDDICTSQYVECNDSTLSSPISIPGSFVRSD